MTRLLSFSLVSLIFIVYLADTKLRATIHQPRDIPEVLALYSLSNVEVHDADTITADVRLGFNVVLTHQTIRLKNFDAYEISTGRRTVKVTPDEISRGLKARDFVSDLLKHTHFKIIDGRYDIYNRIVTDVYYLDTTQTPSKYILLASTLREKGFERPNDSPQGKN
ncbi:hypothetical protein UFOVP448_15 [uncultured Caudovirales phage]|uniref:TNase-like domain-containing protein n=1 Tax=uncultured Caudovirales phage TaxID=2100421 RepID=A0A6J5MFL4_9CAUD|nr:hypothetical protein UFOVP448_15 [uncultured Caudovirales phage]